MRTSQPEEEEEQQQIKTSQRKLRKIDREAERAVAKVDRLRRKRRRRRKTEKVKTTEKKKIDVNLRALPVVALAAMTTTMVKMSTMIRTVKATSIKRMAIAKMMISSVREAEIRRRRMMEEVLNMGKTISQTLIQVDEREVLHPLIEAMAEIRNSIELGMIRGEESGGRTTITSVIRREEVTPTDRTTEEGVKEIGIKKETRTVTDRLLLI